jgi:hypothetical protein
MFGPARLSISLLALLVGASTAAAQNQPAQPIGLSLGLRVGYGIPGGKIGSLDINGGEETVLSDGVKAMVPFGLDVGYRIIPHLAVGASAQYGFGVANEDSGGCPGCKIDDIALGIHAFLHAAPGGTFDPWVGLGVGYELLSITNQDDPFNRATVTLKGLQFLVLQLGADVATGSPVSVGPFFAVSAGKYTRSTISGNVGGQSLSRSDDVPRSAWHDWVTLGVQGKFNL